MRVIVNFSLSGQYSAEVEYGELAKAIAADNDDLNPEDQVELPSEALLAEHVAKGNRLPLAIGIRAGDRLNQLLSENGYEVDSEVSYVTDIEVPPW